MVLKSWKISRNKAQTLTTTLERNILRFEGKILCRTTGAIWDQNTKASKTKKELLMETYQSITHDMKEVKMGRTCSAEQLIRRPLHNFSVPSHECPSSWKRRQKIDE